MNSFLGSIRFTSIPTGEHVDVHFEGEEISSIRRKDIQDSLMRQLEDELAVFEDIKRKIDSIEKALKITECDKFKVEGTAYFSEKQVIIEFEGDEIKTL